MNWRATLHTWAISCNSSPRNGTSSIGPHHGRDVHRTTQSVALSSRHNIAILLLRLPACRRYLTLWHDYSTEVADSVARRSQLSNFDGAGTSHIILLVNPSLSSLPTASTNTRNTSTPLASLPATAPIILAANVGRGSAGRGRHERVRWVREAGGVELGRAWLSAGAAGRSRTTTLHLNVF